MEYPIEEHMHRFACWTAARAVSRGFTGGSNKAIAHLIENSKLRELLSKTVRDSISGRDGFDELHTKLRSQLSKYNNGLGVGRAAKIIAIYIKTAIIPFEPYSEFSRFVHPPVDSILLNELQKKGVTDKALLSPWTKYTEDQYKKVIKILWNSKDHLKFEYFWQIEVHWNGYRSKV